MKFIPIELKGEGITLAGVVDEINLGTAEQPMWVRCPRWTCPCGTEIATARFPEGARYLVTGGYGLSCPGCNRWYMHHTALGRVYGHQVRSRSPEA